MKTLTAQDIRNSVGLSVNHTPLPPGHLRSKLAWVIASSMLVLVGGIFLVDRFLLPSIGGQNGKSVMYLLAGLGVMMNLGLFRVFSRRSSGAGSLAQRKDLRCSECDGVLEFVREPCECLVCRACEGLGHDAPWFAKPRHPQLVQHLIAAGDAQRHHLLAVSPNRRARARARLWSRVHRGFLLSILLSVVFGVPLLFLGGDPDLSSQARSNLIVFMGSSLLVLCVLAGILYAKRIAPRRKKRAIAKSLARSLSGNQEQGPLAMWAWLLKHWLGRLPEDSLQPDDTCWSFEVSGYPAPLHINLSLHSLGGPNSNMTLLTRFNTSVPLRVPEPTQALQIFCATPVDIQYLGPDTMHGQLDQLTIVSGLSNQSWSRTMSQVLDAVEDLGFELRYGLGGIVAVSTEQARRRFQDMNPKAIELELRTLCDSLCQIAQWLRPRHLEHEVARFDAPA